MPPSATSTAAITRALNSAAATALARLVILSLPVLCSLGLWAGHRYLADQVATAPVVVELRDEQARAATALLAQAERIRELEEARRQGEATHRQLVAQIERIATKLDGQSNQLNRLVGAFEARGIIPRQTSDPFASTP